MACFRPWVFIDNVGQAWALGVDGLGRLTLSKVIPIPPQAVVSVTLQDISNGQSYAIAVSFTTFPTVFTSPSTDSPISNVINMTFQGRTFALQVSNGRLTGRWTNDPVTIDPVIGELFNFDLVNPAITAPNLPNAGLPSGAVGGWLPAYTQPGGIGTPSFPAQPSGSTSMITGVPFEQGMGMNTAGCGHWFNNFEEIQTTVACQTAMIVRCPLCGYVVQIISPAALAYTAPYEHISS